MAIIPLPPDPLDKLREPYARALLKNGSDDFKAAMQVCSGQPTLALELVQSFRGCPKIHKLKDHLLEEEGEEAFLPTRKQIVDDVMGRASRAADSDYIQMMKLVSESLGFTGKGNQTNIQVNSQTNNKIMQIPVFFNTQGEQLSDDEWSEKLQQQQKGLVEGLHV